MRETLFRGKQKDNGEWIEGYYVPLGDKHHYILTGKLTIINNFPMFEHFYVIPETIGRYTGFRDKNKVRIFEGDILRCTDECACTYITQVCAYGNTLIVEIRGEECGDMPIDYAVDYWNDNDYVIEVIGNIHDSPEMLKGDC